MKKLLVLTVVAILTVAMSGCQSCGLFRRGSLFPTTGPATTYYAPSESCPSCDSGITTDFGGTIDPVLPGPGSP